MTETSTIGNHTLILGDCLDVLPTLSGIDAVVSDPPYGVNNDCDYTRFTSPSNRYDQIIGDDKPFDPTPWLRFKEVILCGYPYFAAHLPMGTTLVWNKKRPNQLGKFLSDAELAWKKGGVGVYVFNHVWNGFDRQSERGERVLHPTRKPIALFEWFLSRVKGQTILDPFMGSGSCGVACHRLGRRFIGIEKEPKYFEIACRRMEEAVKGAN